MEDLGASGLNIEGFGKYFFEISEKYQEIPGLLAFFFRLNHFSCVTSTVFRVEDFCEVLLREFQDSLSQTEGLLLFGRWISMKEYIHMEKAAENPLLQWGSHKRMRCVKVHVKASADKESGGLIKKSTIRVDRRVVRAEKEGLLTSVDRNQVKSVLNTTDTTLVPRTNVPSSSSPEKTDRLHHHPVVNVITTRSNNTDDTNKISADADTMQDKTSKPEAFVWPKFLLSLSRNEKEEDFHTMKGTKLPLRPKKRAKLIQRAIHSVTPGGWLCDISQERYEVREKKCMKKRPRGLKGMRNVDSDSG